MISALEAARPLGHHAMRVHAKPFSFTSLCNASCISFQRSLSALAKRTLFYKWRRLFCCFASKHMSLVLLFLIAADDVSSDPVAKSRHNAYAVGGRANVFARQRLNIIALCSTT